MDLDGMEIKYEKFAKFPPGLMDEITTILSRMEELGMESYPEGATKVNSLRRLVKAYRVSLLNHCVDL